MAGRTNKAETLVVDYAREKSDPVIDYEVDLPALTERALALGLESFSLKETMRRLAGKNQAHLLQYGRYVIRPTASKSARLWSLDPVAEAVLRRLRTDYFISWHGALWHYGLIDQQSRTLSVAVNRRKRAVELGASRIHFVLLDEKKFFGYELVTDLEWPAQMATVSRALLDSFAHPEYVGPNALVVEALRRAWVGKQLDPAALVADALRFDSPTLNRRLGFFMELLKIPGAEPLELHLGRGYAEPLFPGREPRRKLEVDRRWRVYRDPAIITTALELK